MPAKKLLFISLVVKSFFKILSSVLGSSHAFCIKAICVKSNFSRVLVLIKQKTHHKDMSVFLLSNKIDYYAKDCGEECFIIMQCVSNKNLS